MTTRTPAEVEAAMDAWFEMSDRYQSLLLPGERLFWPDRGAVAKMLQAADAAAAPAVGVTVAWLDARIAEEQAILDQSRKREHRAFHAGQATALMSVRNRMRNEDFASYEETDLGPLLTAQPEPGTHDARATEGGV